MFCKLSPLQAQEGRESELIADLAARVKAKTLDIVKDCWIYIVKIEANILFYYTLATQ